MKILMLLLSALLLCGAPGSATVVSTSSTTANTVVSTSSTTAPKTVKLDGHTYISAAGQEETRDGMVLNVTLDGNKASVGMYDFPMLTFKGLTFEGDFTVDSQGNIQDFSNVRIKGFSPIKILSVTGKVTDAGADIYVKGKAALVFNFTIRYWSGK